MRTAKTLIRLGRCPGWSESLLGAHSLCWFCHVADHMYYKPIYFHSFWFSHFSNGMSFRRDKFLCFFFFFSLHYNGCTIFWLHFFFFFFFKAANRKWTIQFISFSRQEWFTSTMPSIHKGAKAEYPTDIAAPIFLCLFVLRLNVPVNNFSIMSGRSHRFLGN